jgi:hypothetical protein
MLLDEIESENEYNSLETPSVPVLRSTPYIKRQDRVWSPISLHLVGKQFYRFSNEEYSRSDKVGSNVRASVHGHNIFRQFKSRHSADQIIIEEVEWKIFLFFYFYFY